MKKFRAMLKTFNEGQICIEDNGRVVAAAFAVVVDYEKFGDNHTCDEITGNAYLTTHDPNGDVLYGVDVFVDPEYRDMRLGNFLLFPVALQTEQAENVVEPTDRRG